MATKKLPEETIKFNKELAAAIGKRFQDAVSARISNTEHFPNGLHAELVECHNIRRGILSEDEAEVADELQHVGLEFAKRKAVAASDVITDLVRNSIDMPLLEATPIPELPEDIKLGILQDMKKELFVNQFSGDLKQLAASLKIEATGTIQERARAAAEKAEKALRDILAQSDIRRVSRELIDDFCSMPYCVSKSPSYKLSDTPYWDKNDIKVKREVSITIERISPFNFYILNGTTPQNAEAVFEVAPTTEGDLLAMKGKHGWRSEEIDEALKKEAPRSYLLNNLTIIKDRNPEVPVTTRMTTTDTQELVWFHGRLKGQDLIKLKVDKYGKVAIEEDKHYEVCAAICNEYVVYLTALPTNSPSMRPYQVSSYEKINGSWAGIGILQRVKKAERIARSFMYSSIRNAAYSATPTGEIDYDRLKAFYPDEQELNKFNAGHMYMTTPDRTGAAGGKAAVSFFNVPNNTQNLLAGMSTFLDLIDMLAAVPKVGTGDLRGVATLGRSYRGIALVQQAEAKTIRAALDNFDREVIEPQLQGMYFHLLKTTKDSTIKGDARIIARSTSGYLVKEANASARQETLNSAVGLANAGLIKPELLQALVDEVLRDQGIDVDRYKTAPVDQPPAPGMLAPGQPAPPTGAAEQGNVVPTSPGFGGQQVPV